MMMVPLAHFRGAELNELEFGDLIAIESYTIDLARRECRIVLDGALWLLAEPRWLGPGELRIDGWIDAAAQRFLDEGHSVDYPTDAPFLIDHMRKLQVSEAGVYLEGDGSTIDALYFKYQFAGASIEASFEQDDSNVPTGSKRFFPRHVLRG